MLLIGGVIFDLFDSIIHLLRVPYIDCMKRDFEIPDWEIFSRERERRVEFNVIGDSILFSVGINF